MRQSPRVLWPTALALVAGVAATWQLTRSHVSPSLACPPGSSPMLRLELVFGMGRKDGSQIGDDAWRAFLDAEVTPRFPDGLTVLSGYGQWRDAGGPITRESARLLLVWLPPGPQHEAAIAAIRTAWKTRHQQDSVLRADSLGCVGFH